GADGLALERARAPRPGPGLAFRPPRTLRYALRDAADVPIVEGRLPDFRQYRLEGADGATWADRAWGHGRVRLPNLDGDLVLYEEVEGGWAELARAPFHA